MKRDYERYDEAERALLEAGYAFASSDPSGGRYFFELPVGEGIALATVEWLGSSCSPKPSTAVRADFLTLDDRAALDLLREFDTGEKEDREQLFAAERIAMDLELVEFSFEELGDCESGPMGVQRVPEFTYAADSYLAALDGDHGWNLWWAKQEAAEAESEAAWEAKTHALNV